MSAKAKIMLEEFFSKSGLSDLPAEEKKHASSVIIVLDVWETSERLYKIANEINQTHNRDDDVNQIKITLRKKKPSNVFQSSELGLLQRNLSQSLTVNQHTYGLDFEMLYTRSQSGAEEQVNGSGNHLITGRRGAGKSSLLLFAKKQLEKIGGICTWIDCQAYLNSEEDDIVKDMFRRICEDRTKGEPLSQCFDVFSVRRLIESDNRQGFILLDDFHIIPHDKQPAVLSKLYATTRGTKTALKLSAVTIFVKTFDANSQTGMQVGHDLHRIELDYNLTQPQESLNHITAILNRHAKYAGIPGISVICNSHDVLSRLVWASAGVPRDAISLLLHAISQARTLNKGRIAVGMINSACVDSNAEKRRMMTIDGGKDEQRDAVLNQIENSCKTVWHINAFLVKENNKSPNFDLIRELIDLRFLHVINKSITPKRAGESHVVLLLDYGFYVGGARRSKSVKLFNEALDKHPSHRELRALPTFNL